MVTLAPQRQTVEKTKKEQMRAFSQTLEEGKHTEQWKLNE